MKKTQVALAAIALVASAAALADGVSVSGYVDAGIANQSGSGNKLVGGLVGPNVLNFAGTEDLSNGLKAQFFLQSRFEVSTGTLTTGSGYLFNQSYVGLSSDIGTLQIGRNVDALWGNAAGAFDVTGGNNMGSFVGSVITKSASPIFADNMIKYVSPNFNGLNLAVSYYAQASTNNAVGDTAKNDYSVGGTYTLGNLNLGAGYADRATTGEAGKTYVLGAGYDFGVAKVNVVYLDTKNNGTTTGINASAPVPGVAGLSVNAGYYSDDGKTLTNGTSTAVGASYALSKRTNVFANYQTTTGNYKTFVGLSDSNITGAAAKSAFTVGVGHSF